MESFIHNNSHLKLNVSKTSELVEELPEEQECVPGRHPEKVMDKWTLIRGLCNIIIITNSNKFLR